MSKVALSYNFWWIKCEAIKTFSISGITCTDIISSLTPYFKNSYTDYWNNNSIILYYRNKKDYCFHKDYNDKMTKLYIY